MYRSGVSLFAILAMLSVGETKEAQAFFASSDVYAEDVAPISIEVQKKEQEEALEEIESAFEDMAPEMPITLVSPPEELVFGNEIATLEELEEVEDVPLFPRVTDIDPSLKDSIIEDTALEDIPEEEIIVVKETVETIIEETPVATVPAVPPQMEMKPEQEPVLTTQAPVLEATPEVVPEMVSETKTEDKPADYIELSKVPERPKLTSEERAEQIKAELQKDLEQAKQFKEADSLDGIVSPPAADLGHEPVIEKALTEVPAKTEVKTEVKTVTEQHVRDNDIVLPKEELQRKANAPRWTRTATEEQATDLVRKLEEEKNLIRQVSGGTQMPTQSFYEEALPSAVATPALSTRDIYSVTRVEENRTLATGSDLKDAQSVPVPALSGNVSLTPESLKLLPQARSNPDRVRREIRAKEEVELSAQSKAYKDSSALRDARDIVDQNRNVVSALPMELPTLASELDAAGRPLHQNTQGYEQLIVEGASRQVVLEMPALETQKQELQPKHHASSMLSIPSSPYQEQQGQPVQQIQQVPQMQVYQQPVAVAPPQVIYKPDYYVVQVLVDEFGNPIPTPEQEFEMAKQEQNVAVAPVPVYDNVEPYRRPVRRRATSMFVPPKPTEAEKEMMQRRIRNTADQLSKIDLKVGDIEEPLEDESTRIPFNIRN